MDWRRRSSLVERSPKLSLHAVSSSHQPQGKVLVGIPNVAAPELRTIFEPL